MEQNNIVNKNFAKAEGPQNAHDKENFPADQTQHLLYHMHKKHRISTQNSSKKIPYNGGGTMC